MLHEIDLSRTDLNLLVLFEVVLEERHIGRAAERMNLSPSAISHGLGRLRRLLKDPLFLRTPKGVVPSARALELADPIADVLARIRRVVATAAPFDPGTSSRRFIVGAPDGVSAVLLGSLLADLRRTAPGIDISLRQLLPLDRNRMDDRAWEPALADLETRAVDIAILPVDEVPARFIEQTLYEDDFVIVMRSGHPFVDQPTLSRYCEMQHLIVSLSGDARGFIDNVLAQQGLSRRVALTVPNFMMAFAVVSETDFITAVPRRFAQMHAVRFGLMGREAPMRLPAFRIRAIIPKVAMMDAGVAWLFGALRDAATPRFET
jgi:DNA-binding transcriptional LysR family regulator